MAARAYLLCMDVGTTGIKTCVMARDGRLVHTVDQPFSQHYPKPGWVEQDPMDWWRLAQAGMKQALIEARLGWQDVAALGLSNQRETTVLWDSKTGDAVYRAIVWQCRRSQEICDRVKAKGLEPLLRQKTGLLADPYFSASKIQWLLENIPQVKTLHDRGELRFGTVDTWMAYKLSGQKVHQTDPSNAARTALFNIHKQSWDPELLDVFGINPDILPKVSQDAISTDPRVTGGHALPLLALVGDQQAALFGQKCWQEGQMKSTYGTGTFLMRNAGQSLDKLAPGLLGTLAYNAEGQVCYAVEGSIFLAGGILEWLKNGLKVIESGADADRLAQSIPGNEGVYLVPALVGLGAPHWRSDARGVLSGLSQKTTRAHLVRAALEAMGYQSWELFELIQKGSKVRCETLNVDGGVTRSAFLCQFLSDLLQVPICRRTSPHVTAVGAGYLAGMRCGFWEGIGSMNELGEAQETFEPRMSDSQRSHLLEGWARALKQVLNEGGS